MQIIITTSLNNEQALILAKELGYSENITNIIDGTIIPNTETYGEFIKRVYEQIIIDKTTQCFISYNDKQNQSIYEQEDNIIKNEIITSISSEVISID